MTIKNNLRRDGLTGRLVSTLKHIPDEKIIQLHALGYSWIKIANIIGDVHQETIRKRGRSLGLESNFKKNVDVISRDGNILCNRCGEYRKPSEYTYSKTGAFRVRYCNICRGNANSKRIHGNYRLYIQKQLAQIKHRAVKNNIPFDLDAEYMISLWDSQSGMCFYTDSILNINNNIKHNRNSASLDKIVPELGYTKGNVVWCTQRINVMKNDATLDEMKKWMPDWYRRVQTKSDIYKF